MNKKIKDKPVKAVSKPNEIAKVDAMDHIKITDIGTGKVILNKRG